MSNVFLALSKYRPTDKVYPEENYFTEALAFLLNQDKVGCGKFIRQLSQNKIKLHISSLTVKSQVHYDFPANSFIDLEIKDDNNLIFIEIKIKSDLNQYETKRTVKSSELRSTIDQIEKYEQVIELAEHENKYIFLFAHDDTINLHKKERETNILLFPWHKVYDNLGHSLSRSDFKTMFQNFMKEKGMAQFNGFTRDTFISASCKADDVVIKDLFVLKKYFLDFTKIIETRINEIDDVAWNYYIYPVDKSKGHLYNHFHFKDGNDLNMNINTGLSSEGLTVGLWLPLWKAQRSEKQREEGKVDQTKLSDIFNKYKVIPDQLADRFYRLFKTLNVTFSMSLNAKQYDHNKKSRKCAQGMQKGHSARIMTIDNGSNNILKRGDRSLLQDCDKKDVWDTCTKPTRYYHTSKFLLETFFRLIYTDQRGNDRGLGSLGNKFIQISKVLPPEYVEAKGVNITKAVVEVILDFKSIILFINEEL